MQDSTKTLKNSSKLTSDSQKILTKQRQTIFYRYRIKIQLIEIQSFINSFQQFPIYLNMILSDGSSIQSSCIDILQTKDFFEIKTVQKINKIEIINYDNMNKLSKLSFKGTDKQFHLEYKDEKEIFLLKFKRKIVQFSLEMPQEKKVVGTKDKR